MPPLETLIPFFAILLASLSVHEAAHAWTADQLGDPTARLLGRVTLNPVAHIDLIGTIVFPLVAIMSGVPLLGWAKPVPVDFRHLRHPRRDFAIVAAAGPASNVLMALGAALVYRLIFGADPIESSTSELWLYRFISLNVLLAVFNLIPVPPLDGGNVLAGFVPESAARAIDQLRPFGFIILYVLLFAGVLDRFVFPIAQDVIAWLV